MSLLFNNINVEVPQTHLFIIGVGGYPYLKGGTLENQNLDCAKKLGQLTSPPLSAKALYETVINLHNQDAWIKALGSIELLISPVDADPLMIEGVEVGRAHMENIKNSFYAWLERCNGNSENIAMFFFCGHGIGKVEHFLLAEDFGKNTFYPWDCSFAFDYTRRGFYNCRANTQLFFVDSCRLLSGDMLLKEVPLTGLITPEFIATDCPYDLVQKAAAHNEGAYGPVNDVSFYTKALIKALEGGVMTKKGGKWTVSQASLATKMEHLIKIVSTDEAPEQRCNSRINKSTDILRFGEAPNIDVVIDCSPEEAHNLAYLTYTNLDTELGDTREPHTDPWRVNIKPGIYRLNADFPGGQYSNKREHKSFMPPADSETLICEQ